MLSIFDKTVRLQCAIQTFLYMYHPINSVKLSHIQILDVPLLIFKCLCYEHIQWTVIRINKANLLLQHNDPKQGFTESCWPNIQTSAL